MDIDDFVQRLLAGATGAQTFSALQQQASMELPAQCGGTVWPHDGCAIMLSILLRNAGLPIPYKCMALDLVRLLKSRGWNVVPVGSEKPGDVGTTCGDDYDPGVDHVYLVVEVGDDGIVTVADNQSSHLHPRPVAGDGGNYSPTTFFLRA